MTDDTPVTALRRMTPEDEWGDKFYAALNALYVVVHGQEHPAMPDPPHLVMADLIETVRYRLASSDDVAGSGEPRPAGDAALREEVEWTHREADDPCGIVGYEWPCAARRLLDRLLEEAPSWRP